MKNRKALDCVKMKDDIQAALTRAYQGMTDAEREAAIERKLAESRSAAGRVWRELTTGASVAKVAEGRTGYGKTEDSSHE